MYDTSNVGELHFPKWRVIKMQIFTNTPLGEL